MMEWVSYVGFLVLAACALTGARIWLAHGYDGAEFVFSRDFAGALMRFKLDRGEQKDLERMRRER